MKGPASDPALSRSGRCCPCMTRSTSASMNSAPPSTRGSSTATCSPAGEPGGGKSGLLNIFAAHAALSVKNRLVLFDGKQVELGMWDDLADEFVGPDLGHAITTLRRLQRVMDNRYTWLRAHRRRKIEPFDDVNVITSIFDEIALYSTVLGTEAQQREFVALFRDLVARGRAAAMPVIAATQRPSVDIIPKSVRDLFGYRAAFRCTSTGSSNIILGDGWSDAGFDATEIRPTTPGVAYLITEGGVPQRIRAAYLTDANITALADHAAWTRRTASPLSPATTSRRPPTSPDPGRNRHALQHPAQRPRRPSSPGSASWPPTWKATRRAGTPYGATISLYAADTEDGGRGQVAHIAAQLGATSHRRHPPRRPSTATRMFGADRLQVDLHPGHRHGRPPRPRLLLPLRHAMTTRTRPPDHYATLGVPPDATTAQIKKAYRKLARQHHPDTNPGDPDAATRFKTITEAYEVLTDPARRKAYDATRPPVTATTITTPEPDGPAISAVVRVLEDIWAMIRARHGQVPPVVIIIASGTERKQAVWGYHAPAAGSPETSSAPKS